MRDDLVRDATGISAYSGGVEFNAPVKTTGYWWWHWRRLAVATSCRPSIIGSCEQGPSVSGER